MVTSSGNSGSCRRSCRAGTSSTATPIRKDAPRTALPCATTSTFVAPNTSPKRRFAQAGGDPPKTLFFPFLAPPPGAWLGDRRVPPRLGGFPAPGAGGRQAINLGQDLG